MNDFDNALASASAFDAQLLSAANKYSSEYADLVSLTARQVLSALEFTVPKGSSNSSVVKAFVKDFDDLASGGYVLSCFTSFAHEFCDTFSRVNAVDVLYAALPLYIYLNPEIIGMVLKPLLEAQDDPLYTLPYAAQNLGTSHTTNDANDDRYIYFFVLPRNQIPNSNDPKLSAQSWDRTFVTNLLLPTKDLLLNIAC